MNELEIRANAKEAVLLAYKKLGDNASEESLVELATEYMESLIPHPYCIIIVEED